MQYQILKEPMAILDIQMRSSEKITAESGAMVYMKGDIEIQTRTREGGFLKKIKVTALGRMAIAPSALPARRSVISFAWKSILAVVLSCSQDRT